MSHEEIVLKVCRYFCEGKTASEIAAIMSERHEIEMTREEPYKLIQIAAANKWLRLVAPGDNELTGRFLQRYRWLQAVDVVPTRDFEDVAEHTASIVTTLIRQCTDEQRSKDKSRDTKVSIGFVGGYSMLRVARVLASRLEEPTGRLPKTIVLHALTSGYDLKYPQTSPNSFFSYFLDSQIDCAIEFVALNAPAIIEGGKFEEDLQKLPGIRDAYERVKDIDIIVTSAGSSKDPHDMLNRYYEADDRKSLEQAGTVGDILWLPLSSSGPVKSKCRRTNMVLLKLADLPQMIKRGVKVVLALGPCSASECGLLKADILGTILGLNDQIVTHLVVDTRTAAEVLSF